MEKLFFLIIIFIIILVLIGGGFFYWQKNQADVRELNKTLLEGVRMVKSLFFSSLSGGYEYTILTQLIL